MNRKFVISLTLVALTAACGVETEDTAATYTYHQNGADWGTAVTGSSLCDTGVEQSPIDLRGAIRSSKLSAAMVNYENYED